MRTIDELVCFDLYAASRAMTGLYRPLLEPLGLTYPQYLVLSAVPADGGSLTVSQLAGLLDLDHGTLSPLLRRLDAAGLVRRVRSAADERVVQVSLTDQGSRLRAEFPDVQCVVEESLGMSAEEVADLQRTLKQLTARVRADGARATR